MSDDKTNTNDAIEYLMKLAETQGVVCSTVKDGHMLMFKRVWLGALLAKCPNDDVCVFIKRPDFAKGN